MHGEGMSRSGGFLGVTACARLIAEKLGIPCRSPRLHGEDSTGAEHVKIKKSCRADECLTQSNGDGGATRGTGRSPDGSGETPYSPGVVHGDAEDVASAVNHATRKPPWTVPPPARVVDMSDNRPKPTFEDVYRLFGTDDGDDSDRFYLSSI